MPMAGAVPSAGKQLAPMPPRTKRTVYQRNGNDPRFDLRSELYRIAGVDLTDVPGVSAITAQVILTEIGPDVSRFRNASAFSSWLGLCPEKRVSGGKVPSCKTRKVKSRWVPTRSVAPRGTSVSSSDEKRLRKQAAQLGFQVVPIQTVPALVP
jgi:transposase